MFAASWELTVQPSILKSFSVKSFSSWVHTRTLMTCCERKDINNWKKKNTPVVSKVSNSPFSHKKHVDQNNMHKQPHILTRSWTEDWILSRRSEKKLIVTDVWSASLSSADLSSFSSLIPSDWQPIPLGKHPP